MVNLAQKWKSKMERGTYLACWTIHLKINTQYLMPDWWWTWNKMETLVVLVLSASLTHTELLMISYSTTSSSSLPFCKMPELIDGELVWKMVSKPTFDCSESSFERETRSSSFWPRSRIFSSVSETICFVSSSSFCTEWKVSIKIYLKPHYWPLRIESAVFGSCHFAIKFAKL